MKKSLWLLVAGMTVVSGVARGGEYLYKQANNPANYIKLDDVKKKDVEALGLTMPHTFTEEQMIDILRTLRYSRKSLFSDQEKIRSVFEMEYINKFSSYLVQAFAKAKPHEVVVWSIVQKRPLVILRNDRLTQVRMWVAGNELHLNFIKTEAQLEGDYQAHTLEGTLLVEKSKGLRVLLEPQQGQKFGLNSTDELILDLNSDFATIADRIAEEDDRLEAEEKSRKNKKRQERLEAKAAESGAPASATTMTTTVPLSPKDQKNAEQRLLELKSLQEKGLISKEDYEKKKQEILQGL